MTFEMMDMDKIRIIEKAADYSASKKLLEHEGLVFLTYREALSALTKDGKLLDSLKGRWFYLAGRGMDKDGIVTIDDKGELIEIMDRNLSLEMRVRAWPGKNSLSLFVLSDDDAVYDGGRFGLDAGNVPDLVAPVVVGKPQEGGSRMAELESKLDRIRAILED